MDLRRFLQVDPTVLEGHTIVTANGRLIKQGNGRDGVIVVDEPGELIFARISEVSDDEVANLFLEPALNRSGIVPNEEVPRLWEILVNRDPQ